VDEDSKSGDSTLKLASNTVSRYQQNAFS